MAVDNLSYEMHRSSHLTSFQWRKNYELAIEASEGTLRNDINPEDFFGGFEEQFLPWHLNSNAAVGKEYGLNANQEFHGEHTVMANIGGHTVAWARSRRAVSGGGSPKGPHNDSAEARLLRLSKRSLFYPRANYFGVVEAYVLPGYREQGIAKGMARMLGRSAIPGQPRREYLYPDLDRAGAPDMQANLERHGFYEVEAENPDRQGVVLWPGAERTRQVVMQRDGWIKQR